MDADCDALKTNGILQFYPKPNPVIGNVFSVHNVCMATDTVSRRWLKFSIHHPHWRVERHNFGISD